MRRSSAASHRHTRSSHAHVLVGWLRPSPGTSSAAHILRERRPIHRRLKGLVAKPQCLLKVTGFLRDGWQKNEVPEEKASPPNFHWPQVKYTQVPTRSGSLVEASYLNRCASSTEWTKLKDVKNRSTGNSTSWNGRTGNQAAQLGQVATSLFLLTIQIYCLYGYGSKIPETPTPPVGKRKRVPKNGGPLGDFLASAWLPAAERMCEEPPEFTNIKQAAPPFDHLSQTKSNPNTSKSA